MVVAGGVDIKQALSTHRGPRGWYVCFSDGGSTFAYECATENGRSVEMMWRVETGGKVVVPDDGLFVVVWMSNTPVGSKGIVKERKWVLSRVQLNTMG